MAQREPRLISLGYGRWVRPDRVFALIPLASRGARRRPPHLRPRRRDRRAARRLTLRAGDPPRRRRRARRGRRRPAAPRRGPRRREAPGQPALGAAAAAPAISKGAWKVRVVRHARAPSCALRRSAKRTVVHSMRPLGTHRLRPARGRIARARERRANRHEPRTTPPALTEFGAAERREPSAPGGAR